MKTAGLATVLVMIVIGMTPLVLAEEPASGEATGGNVAPEVTSVTAPSPVSPQAEFDFPCTVRDNNTLADISTVVLKVYLTDAGEGAVDAKENHYTFTFTAIDNVWTETGPGPDNDHLITGSCTYPANLTLPSDNYKFVIKLSGAATPGTNTWTAMWIVTDDNSATDNNTGVFTVNEYISIGIDDTTLTFSGNPGAVDLTPTEQPTECTVTSNTNFNIQAKLSGDWSGATHGGTIGMDNTEAAQDAVKTSVKTLSDAYENIWTGVGSGENVMENIHWFLDLPVPLRDDVYETTFYVNAVKEA